MKNHLFLNSDEKKVMDDTYERFSKMVKEGIEKVCTTKLF